MEQKRVSQARLVKHDTKSPLRLDHGFALYLACCSTLSTCKAERSACKTFVKLGSVRHDDGTEERTQQDCLFLYFCLSSCGLLRANLSIIQGEHCLSLRLQVVSLYATLSRVACNAHETLGARNRQPEESGCANG